MRTVRVRDLLRHADHLQIILLNQDANLDAEIRETELNRPGLALTGFFNFFAHERIQLFGQGEWSYIESIPAGQLQTALKVFFSYELVACAFTHDHQPPELFMKFAVDHRVAIFKTPLTTHKFIAKMSDFLDEKLAPSTTVHGVLVEVFGVGILIRGKSGVGKSETALELVERGHRLVADDIVEIICRDESRLYGFVSETIEHHMEIRGLGIISIKDLFGAGSVRRGKRIDLIVHIEDWDDRHEYDRLGIEDSYEEILGVPVASLTIPVRPGRNLPVLIETAAKNHRLKMMGYHPARKFNERLLQIMQERSRKN